jgi:hypothetical protein
MKDSKDMQINKGRRITLPFPGRVMRITAKTVFVAPDGPEGGIYTGQGIRVKPHKIS